jgi:DNA-binding transcriptional MocR family regulator
MIMLTATDGSLKGRYERMRALGLDLDMTRGKPCPEQLSLSWEMLRYTGTHAFPSGNDAWNYGFLEGLPEARELFGEYLGMPAKNTIVLGNSSLAIMHDLVVQMLMRQLPEESRWWDPHHNLRNRPVMLCPVPGYDRHFAICEQYGIEMLPIPLTSEGPDMNAVEAALRGPKHSHVFGMWCTPKYSNPTGITYSEEVCRRLAEMETWPGFRVFWDLAYNAHDHEAQGDELPDFFELCKKAKNEDRPFIIGSTSKITFASGGLGFFAASERNLAWFRRSLSVQTIGGDKLSQLRHVRFLRDIAGIRSHMRKHAAIVKPKFDAACEIFEQELGGSGTASWQKPRGGYFISLHVKEKCAKSTVSLAEGIGVKLTPAGATHPHRRDPDDAWIRFAPTFPPLEEVRLGAEALCICLKMAAEQ